MTVDCKSIERSELVRFQPIPVYVFKKLTHKLSTAKLKIWNAFKFLFPRFIGLVNILFLRKTNTFIKSKYSKNRQWSKSIVYFGLWFGVISAFAFTYYNYRFLFTASYLCWVAAFLCLTTVLVGLKKYFSVDNLQLFSIFRDII